MVDKPGVYTITISTHTLREEGDQYAALSHGVYLISTHTLREEGDLTAIHWLSRSHRFQPTPSARRVTVRPPGDWRGADYFNPHPPRGG